MPAMKRPAAAPSAPGVTAVKKPRGGVAADCAEVASLLNEASNYPQDVISMLSVAVQDSLGETKDTRHDFQHRVIGMLREVLVTVERDGASHVAEFETKLSNADGERAAREAVLEAATSAVEQKNAALEEAKVAHADALGQVHQTRTAKTQAEREQVAGDKAYNTAADQKAKLEAMLNGEYSELKQGPETNVRGYARFAKFFKEFDFDPNLITSGQKTFTTAPSARGSFDEMVIKQLDEAFHTAIQSQAGILAEGEAGKIERESVVNNATRQAEAAVELEISKKELVAAATTALHDAQNHRKACDKSLKEFGPEMKQVNAELSAAQDKQNVVCSVLQKFQTLVDRISDIKEAPEQVEAGVV